MTGSRPDDRSLAELLVSEYGIEGSISALAGENENFLVTTAEGVRYVLKLNGDQQSAATLALEHLAVETLAEADLGLDLPHFVPTASGALESVHGSGEWQLRGRLLHYVSGTSWGEAGPASSAHRQSLGRTLAGITTALAAARSEGPARGYRSQRSHRWDLTAARSHRRSVSLIGNAAHRAVLDRAFSLFVSSAEPFLGALPKALIHGDLNDENLLVSDNQVVGLLDFGDCLVNPTVCELAIALAYVVFDEPDPLAAASEVVASYHRERTLAPKEIEVLFPLICGRLAVSVSIAAERRRLDPDHPSWFVTEARAWRVLEKFAEIDPLAAADALAGGTGVPVFVDRAPSRDRIHQGRRKRFWGHFP